MAHMVGVTSGEVPGPRASARLRLFALIAIVLLGSRHALGDSPSELAGLRGLGDANVVPGQPVTVSEDFGVFGRVAGVPSVQLSIGAVEPAEFASSKAAGTTVPGPHSPLFAPDREPTIRTAVAAFTLSALELVGTPAGGK